MAEALQVDLQAVGVEADGDVELEAGGDGWPAAGMWPGWKVTTPVVWSTA